MVVWVAHGILVSDPVPIGPWILTAFGLTFGLGLGILDLGLGLDNLQRVKTFFLFNIDFLVLLEKIQDVLGKAVPHEVPVQVTDPLHMDSDHST